MNKERELLSQALEELEIHGEKTTWGLIDDIRSYLAAEAEAETIETLKAENFKLASGQCTEGGPWGDQGGTPYCKYAARKPMTVAEIEKRKPAFNLDFLAGIRFAEKHHDIGDKDES